MSFCHCTILHQRGPSAYSPVLSITTRCPRGNSSVQYHLAFRPAYVLRWRFKMFVRLIFIFFTAIATANAHHSKRQGFNPTLQHIDVSGAHAFIAPGASDLRGPCPGLNALANHGYIARNGYTNILEAENAITQVLGAGSCLPLHSLFLETRS